MSASPVPAPHPALPTITGLPPESQPAAIRRLSPDELLRSLLRVHAREQVCVVEVLVHLIEAQRRKLHRHTGCSSLYEYCQRKLRMSKAEACWRMRAARTCKRFPFVLELLATGRLTLTAVAALTPHIVSSNAVELVEAATKLSGRDLRRMLAERFPSPERPTVIRKLVQAFAAHPIPTEARSASSHGQPAAPAQSEAANTPPPLSTTSETEPDAAQRAAGTLPADAICNETVTEVVPATLDPTNSHETREAMVPLHDDREPSATDSPAERTLTAAATHIAHHLVARLEAAGMTSIPDAILFEAVSEALAHAVRVEAEHALAAEEARVTLSQLAIDRWCWQVTVDQKTQDLLEEALCYAQAVASDQAVRQTLKAALQVHVAERRQKKFAQVSRPRSVAPESSDQPSKHASDAAPEPQHASIAPPEPDHASEAPPEPENGTHENPTQPPAIKRRDRRGTGSGAVAPRTETGATRSRHIPAHVKRAVYERDGGRCTFMSAYGTRCDERRNLQFDHRRPFACGGEATLDNTRLLCAPHNQLEAERAFGEAHVQARIRQSRRLRAGSEGS